MFVFYLYFVPHIVVPYYTNDEHLFAQIKFRHKVKC